MVLFSQLAPLPANLPFTVVSKTIGQGAYACIKKARSNAHPAEVFAVKFIHKEYAHRNGRLSSTQMELEVSTHRHLQRHPNIIQFYRSEEDDVWRWIAMELAEGGDLFDKIESDVGIGEDIAHFYFTQLIDAVQFMHAKGVAHRDIKPENILLSADGDLKLADFGLAVVFQYNGRTKLCSSSCGSPPYAAPEVLAGNGRVRGRLEKKYAADVADVWSCAVVLFVLLVGNTPWDEPLERNYEFHDYINSTSCPDDDLWPRLPIDALDLIRQMLCVDPTKRLPISAIKQHAWYKKSNQYRSISYEPEKKLRMATDMFQSMKIDFSQNPPLASSTSLDAMETDDDTTANTAPNGTGFFIPREDIDLESMSAPRATQTRLEPESLLEEPSFSQFTSIPQVPITRTQFARTFGDIVPSHSMNRFFSFASSVAVHQALKTALRTLNVNTTPLPSSVQSSEALPTINLYTLDTRKCPLSGSIYLTPYTAVQDTIQVTFNRINGDPLEWRRLFKNVTILCKDVVFRPEDTMQSSA